MTTELQSYAQDSAQAEMARRSLLSFAERVFPGFKSPRHIRYLANLLEQLEQGKIRRLALSLPVRHGKSVLASQCFSAWYLGRHPTESVILASHSESLAVMHSRVAKQLVEDDLYPFDEELSSDSQSVQRWNFAKSGGGLYSIGIGGAITGRGMSLGICDDALHDGLSQAERDSAWRYFREVFTPRLEPGGRLLVINARMATDDIIGRLQESEDASAWTFVSLPAIAQENDPLGREPGEALWPGRMSLQELESRRKEMGSFSFDSQFQQMPKNPSGNIFKLSWINSSRYQELPHPVKETIVRGFRGSTEIIREPRELVKIMAIDCASKVSVSADYSAIICLATDFKDYYIVDCVREKLEFSDLLKKIVEVYNKHRPIRMVYCEEASAGIGIVQEMRRTTGIPIVGVVPRGSKIQRVESTSNLWESLRVHIPETADWDVQGFIEEHTNFGGGSGHDDRVDACALGISSLQTTVEQKAKTTIILGPADMQR